MQLGSRINRAAARRRSRNACETLLNRRSKAGMRGTRQSKSVNRIGEEPYASYPLPQHTTNLEEAFAWVAAGRGSLRQAMRLFTVDKKILK